MIWYVLTRTLHTAKGFGQPIISGHICPYQCDWGYAPTATLKCQNGKWTDYKCVPKGDTCSNPNLEKGNIIGIGGPFCDMNTPVGTSCRFNCRTGFGFGKIKCEKGGKFVFESDAGCFPLFQDNLYDAPSIEPVKFVAANVNVIFRDLPANDPDEASWDGKKRSMISKFVFKTTGTGLVCSVSKPKRTP